MHRIIYNIGTQKIEKMSLTKILGLINDDRSSQWIPYDATDFIEGLRSFTEYRIINSMHDLEPLLNEKD